jgi:hypothetical protein
MAERPAKPLRPRARQHWPRALCLQIHLAATTWGMKSMSASFMPPTYLPFMPTQLGTLSLEPIWLLQANTQVSEAGTVAGVVGK